MELLFALLIFWFSLHRYMTRRIALLLMAIGWFVGFTIAAIPVIWNKWEHAKECEFDQIFYPWYMVGVITPVFSLVWLCMLFVYCRIWREASKQVKQLRTTGQQEGTSDWKSVQVSGESEERRKNESQLHNPIAYGNCFFLASSSGDCVKIIFSLQSCFLFKRNSRSASEPFFRQSLFPDESINRSLYQIE